MTTERLRKAEEKADKFLKQRKNEIYIKDQIFKEEATEEELTEQIIHLEEALQLGTDPSPKLYLIKRRDELLSLYNKKIQEEQEKSMSSFSTTIHSQASSLTVDSTKSVPKSSKSLDPST